MTSLLRSKPQESNPHKTTRLGQDHEGERVGGQVKAVCFVLWSGRILNFGLGNNSLIMKLCSVQVTEVVKQLHPKTGDWVCGVWKGHMFIGLHNVWGLCDQQHSPVPIIFKLIKLIRQRMQCLRFTIWREKNDILSVRQYQNTWLLSHHTMIIKRDHG